MTENGNIISSKLIKKRAEERWDSKSKDERVRTSLKYRHIFVKHNLPMEDWSNSFSKLTKYQRNILIKGELIRTYDALSNKAKSLIKKKFCLSHFKTKWFKLSADDKAKLLTSILNG